MNLTVECCESQLKELICTRAYECTLYTDSSLFSHFLLFGTCEWGENIAKLKSISTDNDAALLGPVHSFFQLQ